MEGVAAGKARGVKKTEDGEAFGEGVAPADGEALAEGVALADGKALRECVALVDGKALGEGEDQCEDQVREMMRLVGEILPNQVLVEYYK